MPIANELDEWTRTKYTYCQTTYVKHMEAALPSVNTKDQFSILASDHPKYIELILFLC